MANQQTPKSRARQLIKNHIETPDHTLEQLFVEIAAEIEEAEKRGRDGIRISPCSGQRSAQDVDEGCPS
jgi:hypothetical protein